MKDNAMQLHTFTDIPVEDAAKDQLGIDKYVGGLATFIERCDTPMTIAIQGDWGSGKTSMMNMVNQKLGEKIKTIWFNTWQYSQFDSGEQLSVLFISDLVDKLAMDDADSKRLKQAVGLLKTMTLAAADRLVGERVGSFLDEELDGGRAKSASELMVNFKKQFQACIDKVVKEKKMSRVVVFVDDLDRLNPTRAVELLEVLKLFLDCTNCVYVLAIDYGVVQRGIRDKFGDMEDSKGRSFFDKIIQVPFKMPVANYNIKQYVEDILKALSIRIQDKERREQLVEFIQNTTGTNPRSMKRLFNLYSLLDIISDSEDDEYRKIVLLALLCLQHSYDNLYNFIVENRGDLEPQDLNTLSTEKGYSELNEELQKKLEKYEITEENWQQYSDLLEGFVGLVIENSTKGLTEQDVTMMREVISFSTITATGNQTEGEKSNHAIRYEHGWDSEYTEYSLTEPIERTNLPDKWDSAKICAFTFMGERTEVDTFARMFQTVLGKLYEKDKKKLLQVKESGTPKVLETLFYGSRREKIAAPTRIQGTDLVVEGKSGNTAKISQLRALMNAMGIAQSELKLELRLAHRKEI